MYTDIIQKTNKTRRDQSKATAVYTFYGDNSRLCRWYNTWCAYSKGRTEANNIISCQVRFLHIIQYNLICCDKTWSKYYTSEDQGLHSIAIYISSKEYFCTITAFSLYRKYVVHFPLLTDGNLKASKPPSEHAPRWGKIHMVTFRGRNVVETKNLHGINPSGPGLLAFRQTGLS